MSAVVLPFRPRRQVQAEPPDRYDFWLGFLLHRMSPGQRAATIDEAERCGVITERDAYIFRTSWTDWGKADA